jgi:hypothetical protein
MVTMCLTLQVIGSVINNHKNKARCIAEILIILVGFKPGIDAVRVATDEKKKDYQVVEPFIDLCGAKAIELFCEAIPGCVVQCYALIDDATTTGEFSTSALTSIAISAMSVGYTSATISYDCDTDVKKRLAAPDFYGFIPDEPGARTIIFMAMIFNGSVLLIMRAVAAGLFLMTDKTIFAVYAVVDLLLFFVYKGLRRDIYYWIPIYGVAGWIMNIFVRLGEKIIGDYTCLIQFRSVPTYSL